MPRIAPSLLAALFMLSAHPLLGSHPCASDDEPCPAETAAPETAPEIVPEFPGGVDALMQTLATHVRYPAEAADANVEGTTVVSFVVRTDGRLSGIRVVRSSGSKVLDDEAVRTVAEGLDIGWTPASTGGRPVACRVAVPVSFRLNPPAATTRGL